MPEGYRAAKRFLREDTVVRCVYGNVCKALDENFRTSWDPTEAP